MHHTDPELAESLRSTRQHPHVISSQKQMKSTVRHVEKRRSDSQRPRLANTSRSAVSSRSSHCRKDQTETNLVFKGDQSEHDTTDTEESFPTAHASRALFVSTHIIVRESQWRCAHRYEADFYLVRPHGKTKIGELICHIVERSLSIRELLTPRQGECVSEVQNILRALFDRRGGLRKGLEPYKAALSGEKLLVVDTFRLERPYRGTGLAQDAVATFLDGMRKVRRTGEEDEDWTFDGTIVLSPAADETEKRKLEKSGKVVDDVVEERKLIKSWEKSGFEVWVLGDESVGGSVSVMGRRGG